MHANNLVPQLQTLSMLTDCLQAHPIHLWDACTGSLRCVYRAYDAADEITAAYSLAFDRQGSRIWAGYNKCIRVFDLSRPGRDCQTISTFQKGHDGQPGGCSPGLAVAILWQLLFCCYLGWLVVCCTLGRLQVAWVRSDSSAQVWNVAQCQLVAV